MVNTTLDALAKCFEALQKISFWKMSAFLLFLLLSGVMITKIDMLSEPETYSVAEYDQVLSNETAITDGLDLSRELMGVDRIVIRQFHNGVADLSGVSFHSVKTTYVSTASGLGLPSDAFVDFPTSTMVRTLSKMRTDGCIAMRTEDVEDGAYKEYLTRYRVKAFAQCPLYNIDERPSGFVGVGFVDDRDPSYVLPQLRELAGKVSAIFKSLHKEKPAPWKFWKWF